MTVSSSKQNSETAQSEGAAIRQPQTKRPIWEVVAEIGAQIPDEEWAKVPNDGSINYRHYLYGASQQSE